MLTNLWVPCRETLLKLRPVTSGFIFLPYLQWKKTNILFNKMVKEWYFSYRPAGMISKDLCDSHTGRRPYRPFRPVWKTDDSHTGPHRPVLESSVFILAAGMRGTIAHHFTVHSNKQLRDLSNQEVSKLTSCLNQGNMRFDLIKFFFWIYKYP